MTVRQARQLQRIRADGKAVTPGFFDRAWDLLLTTLDEHMAEYRAISGTIYVPTYEALRRLKGTVGQSVLVGGRIAPRDGGEGQCVAKAGDVSTVGGDNGGTRFAGPEGSEMHWERVYRLPVMGNWFGASTASADNAAAIQAACNTLAKEVSLLEGKYRTLSTVFVRQGQCFRGARRCALNDNVSASGVIFEFRPAAADTCIENYPAENNQVIEDIQIDSDSDDNFGISFTTSYSNVVKRVGFWGTFDVCLHADDTYATQFEDIALNGVTIKHYGCYLGTTNAATISRLITQSTYPVDNAIAMVGIGVYTGNNSSIDDCLLQGPTIGLSLFTPKGTLVSSMYTENCICPMRSGDPNSIAPSYGTTVTASLFAGAYNTHPQYASRGPLLYCPVTQRLNLVTPTFGPSHTEDANTWPIVADIATGVVEIHSAVWSGGSNARAEIFRETSGASPSLTITGETYGSYGAVELIIKSDDSYGGDSYGLRIDGAGVVYTSPWTPTIIGSAVSSLLKQAFFIPTKP